MQSSFHELSRKSSASYNYSIALFAFCIVNLWTTQRTTKIKKRISQWRSWAEEGKFVVPTGRSSNFLRADLLSLVDSDSFFKVDPKS